MTLLKTLFSALSADGILVSKRRSKVYIKTPQSGETHFNEKEVLRILGPYAQNDPNLLPLLMDADLPEKLSTLYAQKEEDDKEEEKLQTVEELLGGPNLDMFYDIESGEYIVADVESHRLVLKKATNYLRRYNQKITNYLYSRAKPCKLVYKPSYDDECLELNSPSMKECIQEINIAEPPEYWNHLDDAEAFLPERIQKLFLHLFPDKNDLDYVYGWIHYLIFSRNETFLYLSGEQGTGKTTLAMLMCHLVGFDNFHIVKGSFLNDKFNDYLCENKLIFADEFRCVTEQEKSTLKAIANDYVGTEKKNIEQSTKQNKASFVLVNNQSHHFVIYPEDRRISTPKICDQKVEDVFGREFAEQLQKDIVDPQCLAKVFNFFRYLEPTYSRYEPLKNQHFYDLVSTSVSKFYRFLIVYVTSQDRKEVKYTEIGEIFRKGSPYSKKDIPSPIAIKHFLTHYKHNGHEVLVDYESKNALEATYFLNPEILTKVEYSDLEDL